jgi:RimJ/RimL family protein N-acetyltransferase
MPAMPPTVRLELLGEAHLAAIDALVEDPDVLRFTRVPDPPPPGFARTWLARYESGRREGTCEGFAAVGEDGAFLGLALAPGLDRDAAEAELGYVVAPAARGRGVAAELLRQLTEWAFTERGMLRLVLLIDVTNGASERVAERCGYVREGVQRSAHLKQGRRGDIGVWSRLAGDP